MASNFIWNESFIRLRYQSEFRLKPIVMSNCFIKLYFWANSWLLFEAYQLHLNTFQQYFETRSQKSFHFNVVPTLALAALEPHTFGKNVQSVKFVLALSPFIALQFNLRLYNVLPFSLKRSPMVGKYQN